MKKAAILARVSTNLQEYTTQINELKEYSKELGFHVPDEYIFGEKITGADNPEDKDRLSIENLKRAIKEKKDIEAIFIWELTRLSREPFFLVNKIRDFNQLKIPTYIQTMNLCTFKTTTRINEKGKIETIQEEDLDSTNKIFGAATFGAIERQKIKLRTSTGRLAKARLGRFVGHLAFGYAVEYKNKARDKYIIVDEEESKIVQLVFNKYVKENTSTIEIARYLNEKNILTRNAKHALQNENNENFNPLFKQKNRTPKFKKNIKWTKNTIREMLLCKWYIGKRFYKGEEYHVDAIIDEEVFEMATKKLKNNKSIYPLIKSNYILSNLLYCGKCGNKMHGHRVKINSSYYCSSIDSGSKCGAVGICKENIESIVWDITKLLAKGVSINANEELHKAFKLNEIEIEDIKRKISINKKDIETKKNKINECIAYIKNAIDEKIKSKDEFMRKTLQDLINEYTNEKENLEKDINKIKVENIHYNNQLVKQDDIEEIFKTIDNINDTKQIKEILASSIKKITLHNTQSYRYKIIQIEYIDNRIANIIYDSRNRKQQYTLVDFQLTYNIPKEVFEINGFERIIQIPGGIIYDGDKNLNQEERTKEMKATEALPFIKNIYNNSITILEGISIFSTEGKFKRTYTFIENRKEKPYYEEQLNQYRVYWKKTNEKRKEERRLARKERKPLSEEEKKERKKEYNRRYKEKKSRLDLQ